MSCLTKCHHAIQWGNNLFRSKYLESLILLAIISTARALAVLEEQLLSNTDRPLSELNEEQA